MSGNTPYKLLQILNSYNHNNKRIFDVLIRVELFYSKKVGLLLIFELTIKINISPFILFSVI